MLTALGSSGASGACGACGASQLGTSAGPLSAGAGALSLSQMRSLLATDMESVWQNAGWLLQHKDRARLMFVVSEYLVRCAMSAWLSQRTCQTCGGCLQMVGLDVGHVGPTDICKSALGCAYSEAMRDPLQAVKVVQGVMSSVTELAKLQEGDDQKHLQLADALLHPLSTFGGLLRRGEQIYSSNWLTAALPVIRERLVGLVLPSSTEAAKKRVAGVVKRSYQELAEFGKTHATLAQAVQKLIRGAEEADASGDDESAAAKAGAAVTKHTNRGGRAIKAVVVGSPI